MRPSASAAFAGGGAAPRERFLRDIPATDDPELAALFKAVRDRGELYDDQTLTPAFEARNVNRPGVHATKVGLMSRFGANKDFPWRVPAGADESDNASRWFARIPPDSGKPVVVRHETNVDKFNYWRWYFPEGTTLVEFARVAGRDGKPYVFQVNKLVRDSAGWEPTIFRPELIASVDGLPEVEASIVDMSVADKFHPRRPSFSDKGTLLTLPELAASMLGTSRFVKAPEKWGQLDGVEIAGPTTDTFSLVPKNFTGCLIAVNRQSCARCHQDAGQHVNQFDAFGNQNRSDSGVVGRRHWYGVVRGNDGVLSWHPFTEGTISKNGGNNNVTFRKGGVEVFDPKRHSVADYPGMSK